jgi:hypothetical protein
VTEESVGISYGACPLAYESLHLADEEQQKGQGELVFMKFYTMLLLIISVAVCSAGEALNATLYKLVAIQDIKDHPTDAEYLQVSSQALQMWSAASPEEKDAVAHRMALIHFERATRLAASGNFKAAASELSEEATIQKVIGGRIEFATKSPDTFFRNLIELQAQVTAETGSDPLAGQVGYYFGKDGNGFTAARLELYDDIAGITVPELGADDALALVHRVSRQGGRFVASAPKWFVLPKGRLPDVLKQAKREVGFDSTGKMTVQTLQAGGGTKSTRTKLDSAPASSQLPPLVQSPTPTKAHDVKLPILSEESSSSTPWSIIVVMIVVAIGLLWLLLKKRK